VVEILHLAHGEAAQQVAALAAFAQHAFVDDVHRWRLHRIEAGGEATAPAFGNGMRQQILGYGAAALQQAAGAGQSVLLG
jgi:hypothetical protein